VGIEATLFALLMSVFNLAGLCSYQLGAGLTYVLGVTETNFDHLWFLVTITNLTTLLPLPFLNWLPADGANSDNMIDPIQSPPTPNSSPQLLSAASNSQTELAIALPEPVAIANQDSQIEHRLGPDRQLTP
jgi:hypothetical protein